MLTFISIKFALIEYLIRVKDHELHSEKKDNSLW